MAHMRACKNVVCRKKAFGAVAAFELEHCIGGTGQGADLFDVLTSIDREDTIHPERISRFDRENLRVGMGRA